MPKMKLSIFALISVMCVGCQVAVPLGEAGRYGTLRGTVTYLPPVNLWEPAARFLPDK